MGWLSGGCQGRVGTGLPGTGAALSKSEVKLEAALLKAFRRTGGELVVWVRPETPPLLGEEYVSALDKRKAQQDNLLDEIREKLCSTRCLVPAFDGLGQV